MPEGAQMLGIEAPVEQPAAGERDLDVGEREQRLPLPHLCGQEPVVAEVEGCGARDLSAFAELGERYRGLRIPEPGARSATAFGPRMAELLANHLQGQELVA